MTVNFLHFHFHLIISNTEKKCILLACDVIVMPVVVARVDFLLADSLAVANSTHVFCLFLLLFVLWLSHSCRRRRCRRHCDQTW